MKTRRDIPPTPLTVEPTPLNASESSKTEAVKPLVQPEPTLPQGSIGDKVKRPGFFGLFGASARTLSVGAAAALLAASLGFASGPRSPERVSRERLATMMPRQKGAELRKADVSALDVRAHSAYSAVGNRIQSLAINKPATFSKILSQVFGERLSPKMKTTLTRAAKNGDFPMPRNVQIVDPLVLAGADAAYDAASGRIFVSGALLSQPERMQSVLLEEVGHHIDGLLGPGDAVGDEGQQFRTALEHGRTLSQTELQSGQLDRDHGHIEVNGLEIPVEFSTRAEERVYEQGASFSQADVDKGVAALITRQIEDEILAQASLENPAVTTLQEAQAHFGDKLAGVQTAAKKAVVGDDGAAFAKLAGADLIKQAVTSSVVVRLKSGGVLPEETTLATKLSPMTQHRVNTDEALAGANPKIETWGALVQALAGDVDADGKLDFDALVLQKFLPDAEAQDILKAIQKPITAPEMREKLGAIGFESPMLEGFSVMSALKLTPPKLFGLQGVTVIDKTQQQLLLRTGKVFVDANSDGKVDDADAIHFVDRDGSIKQTTYGKLPDDLKKLVKLNIATATVAEDYGTMPGSKRMKFPHYDAATGRPGEERVNTEFWTISTAVANNSQTSWELKAERPVRTILDVKALLSAQGKDYDKVRGDKSDALKAAGAEVTSDALDIALIKDFKNETVKGHRPSEALNDVFAGNGAKYTTECAHGRTLIRLQGLQTYYKQSFGAGLGAYKFDMLFAGSTGDKAEAKEYVKAFETHKAAHPDATWDSFAKDNPQPEIAYSMEVSRHRIFGKNETVLQTTKRSDVGAAGGDTGYFHNYSVSVEGVKIGYVGENVIDLGYQQGTRRYWGHPGGIQTEKKWQGELAKRRITVHSMEQFSQYFSHVDTKRGSARTTEARIKDIDKKIRSLRIDHPAGFEASIKDLEGSKGWWKALDVTRQGLVDHLDRDKLDAADKLFGGHVSLRDADDAQPIADLLTRKGLRKIADAFDSLDEGTKGQAVAHFGVASANKLDKRQRANTVLFTTLTQGGSMHSYLKGEAAGVVTTERFAAQADWMTGQGKMASKANFGAWLKTEAFGTWYKEQSGSEWAHDTDLAKLTIDQVKGVVEFAFPMVKGKRTVYADVNRGAQMLSKQMATLLKEGKLPDAEYQVDSMAVAPLE